MGCTAAAGPTRHPKWPKIWPPSCILLKNQLYRKNAEIANILLELQNMIQLNIFAAFGSILYVFYYAVLLKNG